MIMLVETNAPRPDRLDGELYDTLERAGKHALLVLIQNGVMRLFRQREAMERLARLGIPVLVDDFSLTLRGIRAGDLPGGCTVVDMGRIVDLAMEGDRNVIWH